MTGETRQQRRKLARERSKAGQRALAQGLPPAPRRPELVAVAQVLRSKLLEHGNDRRASEAAGLAQALAGRSLAAHPGRAQIACAKGCSYCCYNLVAATPPEAFRIAGALAASREPVLSTDAVRERARPLRGISARERIGAKLACPLLVDGRCGVYAVRPLVCRQTTSLSLEACREEFEGIDRDGRIEVSHVHLAHASTAHVALLGALRAAKLPIDAFELGAMLEIVLTQPAAEARWLAGEDVFAALPRDIRRQPEVDLIAERIAEELTA